MTASSIWFILLLLLAAACLALGRWLGERPAAVRLGTLLVALALIGGSALLKFKPLLLHTHLPLPVSIHLEGLVATFPWMLLVGVLWAGRFTKNLRRAARLMIVLGAVYFLFGGVWMILPDVRPQEREKRTSRDPEKALTLQSRADTCVAAACATALRRLGIHTTEGEMCHVVQAKPGRGSTLARAALGLSEHLEAHDITVLLKDLDADAVVYAARPQRPVLVVIRSNPVADHMVVVLERLGNAVLIANPSPGEHGGVKKLPFKLPWGYEMFSMEDFAKLYRGGAIVFEPLQRPDQDP